MNRPRLRIDSRGPAILLFLIACSSVQAICVAEYLNTKLVKAEAVYDRKIESLQQGEFLYSAYSVPRESEELVAGQFRRSEIGTVQSVSARGHWLSKWIRKIHKLGGELRLLLHEENANGVWVKAQREDAYFFVDLKTGTPYIAITEDVVPTDLAHEFDHLERWVGLRDSFLREGRSRQEAVSRADQVFEDALFVRQSERSAVARELSEKSRLQRSVLRNNPVRWEYPSGALPLTNLESLTRELIYPDAQALLSALSERKPVSTELMRALIRKALLLRLTAYQRAQVAMTAPRRKLKLDIDEHTRRMKDLENLEAFFQYVFKDEATRFRKAQVYQEAEKLFESQLRSVWKSLPARKKDGFKPHFSNRSGQTR